MRHLISGLVAAVAVMAAAPAMACGYNPCFQQEVYVPQVAYSGCDPCGGWAHERLADPEQQYYYVNQGPTYTGPGNFAPYRTYQEGYVTRPHHYGYNGGYSAPAYGGVDYGYRPHRYYRPWRARTGYYHSPRMHYGYAPRHYGYAPRHYGYAPHYSARYAPAPYHYGHRVLRRYY